MESNFARKQMPKEKVEVFKFDFSTEIVTQMCKSSVCQVDFIYIHICMYMKKKCCKVEPNIFVGIKGITDIVILIIMMVYFLLIKK